MSIIAGLFVALSVDDENQQFGNYEKLHGFRSAPIRVLVFSRITQDQLGDTGTVRVTILQTS